MYEKIKDIIQVINNDSPIRKQIAISPNFAETYKEDAEQLIKIQEDMDTIYNKVNNPLKVVFMGEVKAGKSTIINSIVGEEVSYVNVVEATAAIIEIEYGFLEKAIIKKKNGQEIKGSIEEINSIIQENINDQQFFSDIDIINIKKNLKNLDKLSIIDTPGLETITLSNEERTKNYIQQSDFIIWVLNCNHLGQSDITENIENIYELGKPIILIANRIDEIDADKSEIVEYLEDELGYMIINVIPMSARKAYQGVIKNDKNLLEKSGYNQLMNTIYSMNSNSQEIHQDSIFRSFNVQMSRDINIHEKIKLYIKEVNDDIKKRFVHFDNYKDVLEKDIQNKVSVWFDDEFLVNEIDDIIKSMSEYKAKKYLCDEYINQKIESFLIDLEHYIIGEWEKYSSKEINEHINAIELKYKSINHDFYIKEINAQKYDNSFNNEIIIQEAKKGAITGGKIGAAIAAYSAWLGPAAANITFVGALGTVAVPFAVAGAVFKGAKYFKNKSLKEKEREELREKLLIDKQDFKIKYCPEIINSVKIINNNILSKVKYDLENSILKPFMQMGINNIEEFINNIDNYVNLIYSINKKSDKVWVIDTNIFIDEPNILNGFDDDEIVVISKQVLDELDKKKSVSSLRQNVQLALENIKKKKVYFEDIDNQYISNIYGKSPDNYILNAAIKYKQMDVTMLTSDKNLIVKCKAENIKSMSLKEFKNSIKYVRVLGEH